MSTPYSIVFTSYLKKITDPSYGILTDEQAEADMVEILDSAIFNFEFPKVDIRDKDDSLLLFNQDLSLDEVEILANSMVLNWIERQVNNKEFFKNRMSSRDFNQFSPADQLRSLILLQTNTSKKLNKFKIKYSYRGTGSNYNQANYNGLSGGD